MTKFDSNRGTPRLDIETCFPCEGTGWDIDALHNGQEEKCFECDGSGNANLPEKYFKAQLDKAWVLYKGAAKAARRNTSTYSIFTGLREDMSVVRAVTKARKRQAKHHQRVTMLSVMLREQHNVRFDWLGGYY